MAPKNTNAASRTSELLEELAHGVERLTNSSEWRRYLDFQGRFHRYSYANALLIAAQYPDATHVAGFSTWRQMRRVVRRGERAIWILAPIRRRAAKDATEPEEIHGFRPVAVFDLSQTDGLPAPLPFSRLIGDDPSGVYERLIGAARAIDFAVQERELSGGANGDCSHARRRIRVERRNAPAQKVKTLAHELAHALLHQQVEDRAIAELEAESTAYVVCRALGIDSSGYSLGYVASWAGGSVAAVSGIRASCSHIQRASKVILGYLEESQGIEGVAERAS